MHQGLLKFLFSGSVGGPQCTVSITSTKVSSEDGTYHAVIATENSLQTRWHVQLHFRLETSSKDTYPTT